MEPTLLLEDPHLIACNKPNGLLTQAPVGIPSLEQQVKQYIKQKYAKPAGVYLGVPHRLDRPVSGVVLFCRNTKAAQRVAEQFQKHTVQKIYWAIVQGNVGSESGTWIDWLRKLPDQSRTERVEAGTTDAKEAITHYHVLQRYTDQTWLELRPHTGRTHQLRVATASRGHPILGDHLYGSSIQFGPEVEESRDHGIALHARSLTLQHPFRKASICIEAEVSQWWKLRES